MRQGVLATLLGLAAFAALAEVAPLPRSQWPQTVAQAVPLSRQLIEHAAEGLDLDSGEGRARMLALARPLWDALPPGMLRHQVLAELASTAAMPLDALEARWAELPRPRSALRQTRWNAPVRQRTPEATKLLDRVAWLLARHPDLWLALSEADHARLGALPLPHGPFFCALERIVHDHGALTLEALEGEILGLEQSDAIAPLMARVRGLHHFEQDANAADDLRTLMHRLHQQAVDEELQWLMESGELSADALARSKALLAERARLRAQTALTKNGG